uniref:Single-stranded DNA binding protein Ssb-like OB fold domain-containing protein n=1 Tax=Salix viminalis TaxID=40686 RepID=A0A6N2KRQ3_SALVM
MATQAQIEQQESSNASASAKPGLRKPVFTKVDQLKPGTGGHTLTVMVLNFNTVLQKDRRSVSKHIRPTRIAECLIGDETGTIIFTARNDQDFRVWKLHYDLL